MLISEVLGSEVDRAGDELILAVQDLLGRYIADTKSPADIPTDEFRSEIEANIGRPLDVSTLLVAVDQSGFASSQSKSSIRPADELPGDIDTEVEPSVDVGKMAGNQAMKDIKATI